MTRELEQLVARLGIAGVPVSDVAGVVAVLGLDRRWRLMSRAAAVAALELVGLGALVEGLPPATPGELVVVQIGETCRVGALVMTRRPRGDA